MNRILYAADGTGGGGGNAQPSLEESLKRLRGKLEKMNNTELEKVLHETTESVRANPEDESAQAVLALVEEIMLKPKQTIRAKAKNALLIDGKPIAKDQEVKLTPQQYGAHAINLVKLACVALVAALFLMARPAKAQQYDNAFLALTNGSALNMDGIITNCNFLAGGTKNINDVIATTKYGEVGLFLGSSAIGASTSNTVWQIDYGPDGTNWAAFATITYPDTGTTPTGVFTNLIVGSAGYVRVTSVASPTSLVAKTNIIAKRVLKPSRFGN
jgi:hypothetical protein